MNRDLMCKVVEVSEHNFRLEVHRNGVCEHIYEGPMRFIIKTQMEIMEPCNPYAIRKVK